MYSTKEKTPALDMMRERLRQHYGAAVDAFEHEYRVVHTFGNETWLVLRVYDRNRPVRRSISQAGTDAVQLTAHFPVMKLAKKAYPYHDEVDDHSACAVCTARWREEHTSDR